MNTLAERLKYIRNLRKLSQQEVADLANISQPTYFKIESGITKRTGSILELANVLNVNPTWLATGQGDIELGAVFNGENTLAERLKFARKLKSFSQADISHFIDGLSQSAYSQLESGRSKTTNKMIELADLFGVNPTWLATGQGDIYQDNNPILGHLSMVVVDKNKSTLPIINGMIYAIGFDDGILCRYLRQNINNTIQTYSELDKQGETLPTDEFFNRYQIMGGVIQYIQSYQWQ